VAIAVLTGSGAPAWSAVPAWPFVLGWFAAQIATSGLEEPGWRGFALPLLQRTYTAERANWLLGFVWAAWHLPFVLYLYRDLPLAAIPVTLAGFAMSIVAMGFVHAWVVNSTGSVALNVLLHAWANV
ncbi:MAG: CPBP family intramembrane glutamic endopeptidase, partial [Trueperaceae bacterium]